MQTLSMGPCVRLQDGGKYTFRVPTHLEFVKKAARSDLRLALRDRMPFV